MFRLNLTEEQIEKYEKIGYAVAYRYDNGDVLIVKVARPKDAWSKALAR